MNNLRGSQWNKWDLHVHTPFSMIQNYTGSSDEEKWENFILDLEALPIEFKVLGINDYLFIEGYEKVLEFKNKGRLKNIETIFPVIEFRLKKFGGNKVFKRVNYHVIFSDKVDVNVIKQQFLNQLYGKYKLEPGISGSGWSGFITPEALKDLGHQIKKTVPSDKLNSYGSDFEEGFNNINFDEKEILNILNTANTYLKDKYLTAVGKTEWDAFQWNDNSISEKKDVINEAHFVFTSAESIDSFKKAKNKLIEENVNSLLLDCSDAHNNSNSNQKERIGKCFTWIKSDTTFEGLKQILFEPDRLCIARKPELLHRTTTNPNKFIDKIFVKKIDGSRMSDTWYDNIEINLNPSLIAIIGNKGNGKSALTDIIGLLGNSYNENYSFLHKKKFRNPQPYNKASNVEAQLHWLDNSIDGYTKLDSSVDKNKPEKVKYIPQNFLETLCVNEDEHDFEVEIKKIIFSHTEIGDRLGFSNLDDLILFKSEVINRGISTLKSELEVLNKHIINLEKKTNENFRKRLVESLSALEANLENHNSLKPEEVIEPKDDFELEQKNAELNKNIIKIKSDIEEKEKKLSSLNLEKSQLQNDSIELTRGKQLLLSLKNELETAYKLLNPILNTYHLDIQEIISYNIDSTLLDNLIESKSTRNDEIIKEISGDSNISLGIENEIDELKTQLSVCEEKLDEPYRLYQKYLGDLKEWNDKKNSLIGTATTSDTIEYLHSQIKYVDDLLPKALDVEYKKRDEIIRKIFTHKSELVQLYESSYKPITDFIKQYGHLMIDYKINLSVDLTLDNFADMFFNHISQGAKGTYIGLEEGKKYLQDLIPQFEINKVEGLIDFLNSIKDSLFFDKRKDENNPKRDIELQLKRGYTIENFYQFLYNLDYLKPVYKLNLADKSLSELSPGERGALLLIFYLFLDKDDKPLIIDQPEENLDNQSVYQYLVHFIKEAKKRRQIIIVTHNPNLAVVCDAEQIIHMSLDKVANNKVNFRSGSIENPIINQTIIDILEGTKPAFSNRTSKYFLNK